MKPKDELLIEPTLRSGDQISSTIRTQRYLFRIHGLREEDDQGRWTWCALEGFQCGHG
jgi:hypothetical protein